MIRQARPSRLYVAADGPRAHRKGEVEKVRQVREIATQVDWPCEVKTLFREKNLGCKVAVSSAISWFFEHEEQGLILEDDCLPHPDYFRFCDELLNYYANDNCVWVITGNNFQDGQVRGDGSYYFSKYSHCWGWASWRRAWKKYDVDMSFWPVWKKSADWRKKTPNSVERMYWERLFDQTYLGKIDTWDYQWIATVWYYGVLTATPNVNLVSNIGFGPDATHTLSINHPLANLPVFSLGDIQHPKEVAVNVDADLYAFNRIFCSSKLMRFKIKLYHLLKKVIQSFYIGETI
ncbi:MAG TPA: glycosyltransferase family 2 protein [Thermosynechococcus sp. M98_K2018_005]|uniref:glycosyltransferase family 2 protein n=1 Tax=Thermosynechococcus sp. M98_K2018_005 TaxID=2747811 RepID=UPI0019FB4E08|nr:glycosyltransferase family 2 protein [Thermosynechococcus sp. M98_K2018_005]HIK36129.1 glycosyltransferase family 2 protein [Thermosynechococcus sp. M98_K2018_005]